eukprot:6836291-Pyramimonas_sp.AAC.1
MRLSLKTFPWQSGFGPAVRGQYGQATTPRGLSIDYRVQTVSQVVTVRKGGRRIRRIASVTSESDIQESRRTGNEFGVAGMISVAQG